MQLFIENGGGLKQRPYDHTQDTSDSCVRKYEVRSREGKAALIPHLGTG
jgi:hypothetical protein